MKFLVKTDVGKAREINEDSYYVPQNEDDLKLFIVADGMGGYNGGEIASSLAIKSARNYIETNFIGTPKDRESMQKLIKSSMQYANMVVYEKSKESDELKGMGTTLVLALVTPEYILFGNIGDSSGFVMKNNHLHKVTHDHTLVNLLVSAGELTEEEARNHPRKNILMNALGINDPIDIDIFDCSMEIDSILLCSDGLTTMLLDEQIEKTLLEENLTIEEKVERLINKANNRGGKDNISVAYLVK